MFLAGLRQRPVLTLAEGDAELQVLEALVNPRFRQTTKDDDDDADETSDNESNEEEKPEDRVRVGKQDTAEALTKTIENLADGMTEAATGICDITGGNIREDAVDAEEERLVMKKEKFPPEIISAILPEEQKGEGEEEAPEAELEKEAAKERLQKAERGA